MKKKIAVRNGNVLAAYELIVTALLALDRVVSSAFTLLSLSIKMFQRLATTF